MKLKLGQIFWMRDLNEYGGLGDCDFECKVVGLKECKFLDGTKFTDFLIQKTLLNNYHESFKSVKSRTHEESLRYDFETKELKYWFSMSWPAEHSEWRKLDSSVHKTKPKGLRRGSRG